jgi:hypothetical protein
MEICIYDARGNEIINTTINHGSTIEDLYNQDAHGLNLYRGTLGKISGPPIKTFTPGLTISKVADVRESYGIGKNIYMVEWSSGFCDYYQLRAASESSHRDSLMPPQIRCSGFSLLGEMLLQVSLSH